MNKPTHLLIKISFIEKKIKDLESAIKVSEDNLDNTRAAIETFEKRAYEEVLNNCKLGRLYTSYHKTK